MIPVTIPELLPAVIPTALPDDNLPTIGLVSCAVTTGVGLKEIDISVEVAVVSSLTWDLRYQSSHSSGTILPDSMVFSATVVGFSPSRWHTWKLTIMAAGYSDLILTGTVLSGS